MAKAKNQKTLTSLALGVLCLASQSFAATPLKLGGVIVGAVQNGEGVPQLGAVVQLYNRQERPAQRVLSDATGKFEFVGLPPDRYSLKVTMAASSRPSRRTSWCSRARRVCWPST